MDEFITKALIGLGSSGISTGILWLIAKRFMDETVTQMSNRIDALEASVEECAEDRRRMHKEIVELARRSQ